MNLTKPLDGKEEKRCSIRFYPTKMHQITPYTRASKHILMGNHTNNKDARDAVIYNHKLSQ
jgi:hypothetical protein